MVLPLALVEVLVAVVVRTGKVLTRGGLLTRLVTLQLSVALTLKVTLLRLQRPASAASTRLDRKGVVEGKRVDLGGRRIIKKKMPLASGGVLGTVDTPTGKGLRRGGLLTRFWTPQ